MPGPHVRGLYSRRSMRARLNWMKVKRAFLGKRRSFWKSASTKFSSDMNKVHTFTNTRSLVLANTVGGAGGVLTWQLNDIASYADYTTLFSQYQIKAIELHWQPYAMITNPQLAATVTNAKTITMAFDPQNNSTPTKAALQQYANCTVRAIDKPFNLYIKPYVLNGLASVAATADAIRSDTLYINSGNPTVPHFALRYYVDDVGIGANHLGEFVFKYHLAFKCQS